MNSLKNGVGSDDLCNNNRGGLGTERNSMELYDYGKGNGYQHGEGELITVGVGDLELCGGVSFSRYCGRETSH